MASIWLGNVDVDHAGLRGDRCGCFLRRPGLVRGDFREGIFRHFHACHAGSTGRGFEPYAIVLFDLGSAQPPRLGTGVS